MAGEKYIPTDPDLLDLESPFVMPAEFDGLTADTVSPNVLERLEVTYPGQSEQIVRELARRAAESAA
jgi:hypothetical protein